MWTNWFWSMPIWVTQPITSVSISHLTHPWYVWIYTTMIVHKLSRPFIVPLHHFTLQRKTCLDHMLSLVTHYYCSSNVGWGMFFPFRGASSLDDRACSDHVTPSSDPLAFNVNFPPEETHCLRIITGEATCALALLDIEFLQLRAHNGRYIS